MTKNNYNKSSSLTDGRVFVSAACFQERELSKILDMGKRSGITSIELGSTINYDPEHPARIQEAYQKESFKFLFHHYFPSPEKSFVLNLGSGNDQTWHDSIKLCCKSVRLCAQFKVPFYSVHAGYCVEPSPRNLGNNLNGLERWPFEISHDRFIEGLKKIAEQCSHYGIECLVENNVLTSKNLTKDSRLLLGVAAEDLIKIFRDADCPNVGLLVDTGHLKVSANTLKFDPDEWLQELSPFIKAVHLSDNDGQGDANQKISRDSWFWPALRQVLNKDSYIILEVYRLTSQEIHEQTQLIFDCLKNNQANIL